MWFARGYKFLKLDVKSYNIEDKNKCLEGKLKKMNETVKIILIILGIIIAISLIVLLVVFLYNPFRYPYKRIQFNVTGTRRPNMEDYIDNYLISNKLSLINAHMDSVEQWKKQCEEKILKSPFKKRRREQFNRVLDARHLFRFSFFREKTRYKQVNYVKYPYIVTEEVSSFTCDYAYLEERYKRLEAINFESILSDYNSKEQRRLMTKELREKIAIRDNYTCQICGKYMPDGVGLHIDHIIPIAKGGKSVPSNLQVLCSKCNGRKSSR